MRVSGAGREAAANARNGAGACGGGAERGHEDAGGGPLPLLVRVDQWAKWRDVRRVIAAALDPAIGFWKLEIAVAETDEEAKLGDAEARRASGKQ